MCSICKTMMPRDILAVVLILIILETTVAIEHGHPIKTSFATSTHFMTASEVIWIQTPPRHNELSG